MRILEEESLDLTSIFNSPESEPVLPDSDGESETEASSKRRRVDEEWTKLDLDNFSTEKSKLGQVSNQGCTVFNREGWSSAPLIPLVD